MGLSQHVLVTYMTYNNDDDVARKAVHEKLEDSYCHMAMQPSCILRDFTSDTDCGWTAN